MIPADITIEALFEMCDLAKHPGYEGFYYWPIGDSSNLYWLRFDANDVSDKQCGIQLLDGFEWVPIEHCPGISVDEVSTLDGQLPGAIPINKLHARDPWIMSRLPGFVYDILTGRYTSVSDAKNDVDPY